MWIIEYFNTDTEVILALVSSPQFGEFMESLVASTAPGRWKTFRKDEPKKNGWTFEVAHGSDGDETISARWCSPWETSTPHYLPAPFPSAPP